MSKPKYTPWRVGINGHDADMDSSAGKWVPVLSGNGDDDGVVAWVHPAHSNKVAAAPELYEALRDLLAWEQEQGGWDAPCWRRARAALGKAGGE